MILVFRDANVTFRMLKAETKIHISLKYFYIPIKSTKCKVSKLILK